MSAGLTLGAQCTVSSLVSGVPLLLCSVYVMWFLLPTVLNKLKSHKGASYWRLPSTPPRSPPVPLTGSLQNTCEGLTCPSPSLLPQPSVMRTVGVSGLLVGSQEMPLAGFLNLSLIVGLNSALGICRAVGVTLWLGYHLRGLEATRVFRSSQQPSLG